MRQSLAELPDYRPATESLAQMTLVRANWEPIARRYLQQASEAKDPTLAASLHGSVAELYLKYRPGEPRRGSPAPQEHGAGPDEPARRRRTSNGSCARPAATTSCSRFTRRGPSGRRTATTGRRPRSRRASSASRWGAPTQRRRTSARRWSWTPNEPRALRAIRAALTQSQSWAELVKVLDAAARTRRGERDVGLLVDLATLFWKQLDQPERRSRSSAGSARSTRQTTRWSTSIAPTTRRGTSRPQFLSVLAQAQKTEPDIERRAAMGIEMARAAEQRPQHADKAIEIWKGVLRVRPHLPEGVASLKRLYTATEKWNALLELLKDELEAVPAADVDERINRHLEIVGIYRDRLNLDVMVVTTYLNILALKPDHPAALAALASRYEAQGRYGDLVQILSRQAEAAPDAATRVALHRRIASVWADKLGKHQNAVASFEKILEAEPGDTETAARLKELYTKSRSWRPLIEVLRRELPHVDDAGRRARLVEMARLAGERLNDAREAITLYNQVLAIAPQDPEALAGLATLYERERRWPALVEILDRQRANAEGNPAAELPLLERRGTLLYERMAASDAAIAVFRRIQALDPKNARAARALREIYAQAGDYVALESLYAEQGAYGELCDQLTSLADRTADMGARTRLLERVATLAQEKLNQPDRALKAYERILTTEPRNRKAALALIPLYRTGQKWPRLLATYEALLGPTAAADDGVSQAERLELFAEARRICEERLGSKALAYQWCARAFQIAPKNPDVRADLERLAGEADEWGALAGAYEERSQVVDRRRGADLAPAPVAAHLVRRASSARKTRARRRADPGRARPRRGGGGRARAGAGPDQGLAGAGQAAARARRSRARRRRAREAAAPHRAVRRGAGRRSGGRRPRRWTAICRRRPSRQATNERAVRGARARAPRRGRTGAALVEALRRELDAGAATDARREELLLRIAHLQETRLEDRARAFASYRRSCWPTRTRRRRWPGSSAWRREQADKASTSRA